MRPRLRQSPYALQLLSSRPLQSARGVHGALPPRRFVLHPPFLATREEVLDPLNCRSRSDLGKERDTEGRPRWRHVVGFCARGLWGVCVCVLRKAAALKKKKD